MTAIRIGADSASRRRLCEGLPIHGVPVLFRGTATTIDHMKSFVGPSVFRTPSSIEDWRHSLERACALVADDFPKRLAKMDDSDLIEGIYVKIEDDERVVDRLKWVRPGFVQTILAADEHWQSRFPVPNLLEVRTDVFPSHLARRIGDAPVYDADNPSSWAPWIRSVPEASATSRRMR